MNKDHLKKKNNNKNEKAYATLKDYPCLLEAHRGAKEKQRRDERFLYGDTLALVVDIAILHEGGVILHRIALHLIGKGGRGSIGAVQYLLCILKTSRHRATMFMKTRMANQDTDASALEQPWCPGEAFIPYICHLEIAKEEL